MLIEHITELDKQFGKDLVRSLRAWHDYESKRKTGIDVIDFRLAPQNNGWNPPEDFFKSRTEALRNFRRIAGDIHRDTADGIYLGAKADAAVAYLEILTDLRRPSYEEDMEKIAGYSPRLIPYPEIESIRKGIVRVFNDRYGLSFDRSGWEKFFQQHGLTPDQLTADIKYWEKSLITQVVKVVGARSQPRINLIETSQEDYWIGWVRANRDYTNRVTNEFRVNKHLVNKERIYQGVGPRLLVHEEGGHAISAQSFADNIEEGSINPGRGDTTVPGPEQWMLEGWASSIIRLYPAVLDSLPQGLRSAVHLAIDLQYLTDINYTNAQYRLLLLEERKERVARDLEELLPHESRRRIELMINGLTRIPSRMFYLPVYGDSSYFFRDTVEQLSPNVKQKLIDEVMRQPMIPDQVKLLTSRFIATST